MTEVYPRMLYAKDGAEMIWGERLRVLTVNSLIEEDEARKLGYVSHPDQLRDATGDEGLEGDEAAEPVSIKRGPGRPKKESVQ